MWTSNMESYRGHAGLGIGNRDQTLGAAYAVSLPVFAGPLDLLLHLIEREELDISEVSLVAVTDAYLHTLEQLEEIQPGALADFLVVASRLLYIKSARLLPKPPVADEGEEEASSDELIRNLIAYRQFKQAAGALRLRESQGVRVFVRPVGVAGVVDLPLRPPNFGDVDLEMLQGALRRALQRMPDELAPPKVQPYPITVAEQIESVRARFAQNWTSEQASAPVEVAFSELLSRGASRLEIVVTFLAVLELVKQQELAARQSVTFGEIVLVRRSSGSEVRAGLAPPVQPEQ
jgi:segregation and condensation protein A